MPVKLDNNFKAISSLKLPILFANSVYFNVCLSIF